ncbi:MAG: hypothetical protein AB7I41_08625 [Candidatus Sericytochromatia bacterium]
MRMKTRLLTFALLSTFPLSACSTAALQAINQIAQTSGTDTADIQSTVSQILALNSEQQTQLARTLGSVELLDWSSQNQNASAEVKQRSATALLQNKPQLLSLVANRFKNQSGGPGIPPAGPGGGMGPGGLPPNFAEIQSKYPELAKALEAMQNLSPEERRSKLEALFQDHPEWQAALAPPQGMGPSMGGPMGSPPTGFVPGGSPPPWPVVSPSASPAS